MSLEKRREVKKPKEKDRLEDSSFRRLDFSPMQLEEEVKEKKTKEKDLIEELTEVERDVLEIAQNILKLKRYEAEFEIEMGLLEDEPNYIGIAILFIAIIAFFLILRMREKDIKKGREEIDREEADEIKKVIDFIKKEGGRTTQKDIRKNFPQSEAKISLIVSELEDAGRIRKIKKGRGNIIILNK